MLDWDRLLLNNTPADFLLEVALRSGIMFLLLLIVLKLTGKRGVKQLSVFEIVIIISLGSAAGDPMFYEDVAILHGAVVLLVVLVLYRIITWLTAKSPRIEKLLEGETVCLVDEGKLCIEKFDHVSLGQDELFTELRLKNVEHLGQVRKAYLETSGDISVFFYEDKAVRPGLPILPEVYKEQSPVIIKTGSYCCAKCGTITELTPGNHVCSICKGLKWLKPIQTARIA